jgi:hypothetical protein
MTTQLSPRHAATRVRHGRRTAVLVAAVAGAVVLPSGIAEAYWRTAGTGTGSAAGGSIGPLLAQTATAAGSTLVPGGTGTLVVRVTNPNPVAVTVTGVGANGPATASGGLGTCTSFVVTVKTPTAGLPATIPAGTTVSLALSDGVELTSAQNGCQGATFSVPVTATGRTS